jgi:HlyD family secretion protein
VKIVLKDPPPGLRPGLNASADITTATREDVLAVPIQAVVVREVDEEGNVIEAGMSSGSEDESSMITPAERGKEKDGVFVIQNEKAVFTPVKTGIMGDTEIEVVEGVEEGEEIVTGSYRTLRRLENDARLKVEKRERES